MAREIRNFQVTCNTGTTATAPQTTALSMPARIVRRVRIRVPDGPRGEVGFQLASGGQPFIPYNAGAWVVANDEVITWDLVDAIDTGAWQLRCYNTGSYTHSLFLTFELDPILDQAGQGFLDQAIPLDQLNA